MHSEQVWKELKDIRLLFAIGKGNVVDTFDKALERAEKLIEN